MKVLQVVRQYAPGVGGLENFVGQLVKHTRPLGIESTVLTLDRAFASKEVVLQTEEIIDGVRVIRIPYWGSTRYPIALKTLNYLEGFNLIHVHALDFFADFLAATQMKHRTPMVLSTHGGFFHTKFAQNLKEVYFKTITPRTLLAYERVLACSVSDFTLFQQVCGHVQLLENGVDVQRYKSVNRHPEEGRIISVGRLARHKRLDRVIDAFALLSKDRPDIHLSIVGPDWENLTPELSAQANRLGVGQKIDILGRVDDVALNELLSRARLMVSASEYEGFGISAVEAMAAGVPTLLQPIPSFQRIAKNGSAAGLVDFADVTASSAAIDSVLSLSPVAYEELVQKSRAAADEFSWPATAQKFKQVYLEAAGNQTRRIYGVRLNIGNQADLDGVIESAVSSNHPVTLGYANAHTLNLARKDPSYRACLNRTIVSNDGVGVSIASKFLYGRSFPDKFNYTDFLFGVLANSGAPLKLFLLGSRPGVADKAAMEILARFPNHEVVGTASGFFSKEDEHALINCINDTKPDVLLVGMGNPIQEFWLDRHRTALKVPVCISVGAFLDFAAGEIKRAPMVLRFLRLEWLFRLIIEPKRMWRRYLIGNASFIAGLFTLAARCLPSELTQDDINLNEKGVAKYLSAAE